jgi:hypothetical protein
MSDMEKVRNILNYAKTRSDNQEVNDLIDEAISHSFREYVKERAPVESRELTRADIMNILDFYRQHPETSIQKMAETFDVNPGRISEVISGKHKLQKGENK